MYEEFTDKVKGFIREGLYDQNEIFKRLYPTWNRHYSILRELIAKEKNR